MGLGVSGLGFSLGFGVTKFKVLGLGSRVQGLGCGVRKARTSAKQRHLYDYSFSVQGLWLSALRA